ncbi:uncharacterized protein TNCV_2023401 [Trichonephila clavipes]|nr:uncharacterized protein TNCV_2023401 [Trichonephila clavipes]
MAVQMVTAQLRYECIMHSFLIDECLIIEFFRDVRPCLNVSFGTRWIWCGEPIPCPPRSPDLSSLDYSLWEHLKSLVQVTALDSDEDLVARISEAAARVRKIPDILERVCQSLHRRCQACIATAGRNLNSYFKHYTSQQRFQ